MPKAGLMPNRRSEMPGITKHAAAPADMRMAATSQTARGQLAANLNAMKREIGSLRNTAFRRELHPPTYEFAKSAFGSRFGAFDLYEVHGARFFHARQVGRPANTHQFSGDKIHISVNPKQMAAAFNAAAPLLLSPDNPFDKWKVTDLTAEITDTRIGQGAQFTLYAKPQCEGGHYDAAYIKRVADFIQQLESDLSASRIRRGQRPDSDVASLNWHFASYRHEFSSDKTGSEIQHQRLLDEPFFMLVLHARAAASTPSAS